MSTHFIGKLKREVRDEICAFVSQVEKIVQEIAGLKKSTASRLKKSTASRLKKSTASRLKKSTASRLKRLEKKELKEEELEYNISELFQAVYKMQHVE
jgi:regulator of replication initiation timing